MLQTVATLGARDFSYSVSGFCHVFIVTGEPTLHLPRLHSSNAFKIQMFGDQNCHVRTHLERISRYLSTFKSKRCLDVAGRDSCRLQLYSQGCLIYSVIAKTTMNNFSGDSRKPRPFCSFAATLARFFHVEIF